MFRTRLDGYYTKHAKAMAESNRRTPQDGLLGVNKIVRRYTVVHVCIVPYMIRKVALGRFQIKRISCPKLSRCS